MAATAERLATTTPEENALLTLDRVRGVYETDDNGCFSFIGLYSNDLICDEDLQSFEELRHLRRIDLIDSTIVLLSVRLDRS